MKLKMKAFAALVLAALTVFALALPAAAHDAVNMNKTGSIKITMRYKNKPVPGGTLAIHKVGDVVEDDGDYSFALTTAFAASKVNLNDLTKAEANAKTLSKFVTKNSIKELATKTPDANGEALFENLKPGMYLIIQTKAARRYSKIDPFLVSLPYMENGKYVYDLTAEPKSELEPEISTTKSTWVPQTGQLWWPVPLLLCGGMALVVAGVGVTRKKEDYEG